MKKSRDSYVGIDDLEAGGAEALNDQTLHFRTDRVSALVADVPLPCWPERDSMKPSGQAVFGDFELGLPGEHSLRRLWPGGTAYTRCEREEAKHCKLEELLP